MIEEKIERGENQALFNFLPGQLIEYPQANTVDLVRNWGSYPVQIDSKKWVLRKVVKTVFGGGHKYAQVDPTFPRSPDVSKFFFGTPYMINLDIYPLVFTESGSGI